MSEEEAADGKQAPGPRRIEPASVFPRIKHRSFLSAFEELHASATEMPLTRPLAGDLLVAYAIEESTVFRMMNMGDTAALGVTQEVIHDVAVENLRQRVQLQIVSRPPVIVVQTGDALEACVLLLDEVWPQIAAHLPGDVVVGVPTRSALFVAGSASPEGLALARECVIQLHGQEPVHRLSEHLFIRRGMQWEPFT